MRPLRFLISLVPITLLVVEAASRPAQAIRIRGREFPVPTAFSAPRGITAGPDGNLWFTEFDGNKTGRVSTTGVFTEYPIPTASSYPQGITAGPDGNLWFTEYADNKIGAVRPRI
jgi:streptogramin lyase